MAHTEKVSDQVKQVRLNLSASNHRFFNMIVAGVQKKLEESVPGLELKQSARAVTKSGGTIVLMGQVPAPMAEDKESAENKVRQTMDSLKNPSNLLSAIE
jgi:hypothetical protein